MASEEEETRWRNAEKGKEMPICSCGGKSEAEAEAKGKAEAK
jgi:hypothetical protein